MLSGSADRIFGYAGPLVALDSWVGRNRFCRPDLFRFRRLFDLRDRRGLSARLSSKGQFPFSICRDRLLGFLAALAHLAFHFSARLPLHSARRKSGPAVSCRAQSRHRHVPRRPLAWRGLDVCRLGIIARLVSRHRTGLSRSCSEINHGRTRSLVQVLLGFVTYGAVCVAWVFFRHPISRSPVECSAGCSAARARRRHPVHARNIADRNRHCLHDAAALVDAR